MIQINCSDVPEKITDFAFDQTKDEIGSTEPIEDFNYKDQVVIISEDTPDNQVDFIVSKLLSKAHEKVVDMNRELEENPNMNFEYTGSDVSRWKQDIMTGCFTVN